MSWGCGKTSVAFRPTEREKEAIEKTIRQYPKIRGMKRGATTEAIHKLLEKAIQLEHSERGFFEFPLFLRCQDANEWLPTKECLERCRHCHWKKHCDAWKTPTP